MKKRRIQQKTFLLSVFLFLISAVSVLLLPFTGSDEALTVIDVLVGLIFWIGLAGGVIVFAVLWYSVQKNSQYKQVKQEKAPGYRSVFSNPLATVSDIVAVIAIIVVVISLFLSKMPDILVLAGLFLGLCGIYLHFLLNGRVYQYLFYRTKREER